MYDKQTLTTFQSSLYPKIICDYLANHPDIEKFYEYPLSYTGIENAIKNKKFSNQQRNSLYSALIKQHAKTDDTNKKSLIEQLKQENTYTVTTGHQLCIYTGPLYFIYKILQTIKLADDLNTKFTGKKFIPVFWMATEDHDLEEINHIHLFGKKLVWQHHSKGPAGKLKTNSLSTLTDEIKNICGDSLHTEKLITIFRNCYQQNKTLSEATRDLVYSLLADKEFIVVDGDDKELKELFKPVFKKEIKSCFIKEDTEKTNRLLKEKNYKIQANPRDYNLFYMEESYRERIIVENNTFYTSDKKYAWSKEKILDEIDHKPEKFSPNVLMRPLYQETVLPNIAYIGGAGEISYWLQLKKCFESCNLNLPVLIVRNTFMLIDSITKNKISKTGFKSKDFFREYTDLCNTYIEKNNTAIFDINKEKKELELVFTSLKNKTLIFDSSLGSYIEAEKAKIEKFLDNLYHKIMRLQKQKHENTLNQIRSIKEKLFPDNMPAERKENFISYYINHGNIFFTIIYDRISPLHNEIIILEV